MNIEQISSRQNAMMKFVVKLKDRQKRNKTGLFLVEGFRELSRAIAAKKEFESILFCRKFFKNAEYENLIKQCENLNIHIFELTDLVYEKISLRNGCDGVIGICKEWDANLKNIKLSAKPFILVAESIEKAGNLGALIRSAESVGVDGLIVCDQVTDIFNPNVIRSSQGAVFSLPIAVVSKDQTLKFLQNNNISIYAAAPSAESCYWDCNFKNNIAVLVGSEDFGLSEFWMKNSLVKKISIPQCGVSDSLNVNDAAVVILYEILRQRSM